MLSKSEKYFDEDKANCMTRKAMHEAGVNYFKHNDLYLSRIANLPDEDPLKFIILDHYNKFGQNGMTSLFKEIRDSI
jgi:hypothetical protein